MRYLADYNAGKWLLINTADASAKWYTEKYIMQLSKKHKINGVGNGSIRVVDKDKISFYLSKMLKSTDYPFYLKSDCFYYIGHDFSKGFWTLMEYNKQDSFIGNYKFVDYTGLLDTLRGSNMWNIIGSKCLYPDLQRYYIIKNNSLVFVDTYLKEQLQRAGIVQSNTSVFAKGNSLYTYTNMGFVVINTRTNKLKGR